MVLIIVDLEATCWDSGQTLERQEIIEIGAVRVRAPRFEPEDTFLRPVRPTQEPVLSQFCTRLTGIRQQEVDGAEPFPVAFAGFVDWIGPGPFRLASWGAYDLNQFAVECRRHGVPMPREFLDHVNLKTAFAAAKGGRPCGMEKALSRCGLPLDGRHHRALDDALNIARLAALILTAMK